MTGEAHVFLFLITIIIIATGTSFFFFPEKLILFLKHSIFLQLSFTNAGVHKLYQNVVLMRTMRPVVMEITVRKEMNGYTHSCTL